MSSPTTGNNNPYYEKFIGFFGGAENYPSVKLWTHALDVLDARARGDLCTTFVCDLGKFSGSQSLGQIIRTATAARAAGDGTYDDMLEAARAIVGTALGIPLDMAVAIYDVYFNLIPEDDIPVDLNDGSAVSNKIKNVFNYVIDLNTTEPRDRAKCDAFLRIINMHIENVMNKSGAPIGTALTAGFLNQVSSFTWKLPTNLTFGRTTLANLVDFMSEYAIVYPAEYKKWHDLRRTNYNLNRYQANQIMTNAAARNASMNKGTASPDSFFKGNKIVKSTETYYRKESEPNKLFKKVTDASGNTTDIEVQQGSPYYTTRINLSCNALVKPNDANGASCTTFMMDCLEGGGLNNDKCKNYLQQSNFFEGVKKEVFDDMLPDSACFVLDKLGFQRKTVTKGNYKNLKEYQEINEWLQKINTDAEKATFDAINNNTNLKAYLQMLLNLVNNNPAILNTNYYEKSNTIDAVNARLRGTSRWTKAGIEPFMPNNSTKLSVPIDAFRQVITQRNNALRVALLPTSFMPVRGFGLVGGGSANLVERASKLVPSRDMIQDGKRSSTLLKDLVSKLMEQLESMDKSISEPDKVRIHNTIEKLEELENELLISADVMYEYVNVLLNYPDESNELSDKQSLANIDKWIESTGKRLNKLEKGSDQILNLAKKLVETIELSLKKK